MILERISSVLSKRPIRIIFISFILIILLSIGAQQVRMATGNDTLVSSDTKVYRDNMMLEEEFGGESIVVLYEAESIDDLMTVSNLEHMKELETRLKSKDEIFSIISPATIVEQIADKQGEKYREGIVEVIDGLDEMGSTLIETGDTLLNNEGNRSSQEIDKKIKELNQGLTKMIKGQEKLRDGTTNLVKGYAQFGKQISETSLELEQLASQFDASDPEQKQQAEQLKQIGINLNHLSAKMIETFEKSPTLPDASTQTIKGLKGMAEGLTRQEDEINALKVIQNKQLSDMQNLGNGLKEMGHNLTSISENLNTMLTYSDTMKAGLPQSQNTLEYMIYEDGELRQMFSELIINNQYMTMIIKFEGGVSDESKSEVVALIQSYLNSEPLDNTETMVSGKPVLDDSIRTSMKESMKKMMMMSILFMVIALTIVFKVKWRLLPLGIILIAVVGTVGIMGWTGIPITMVSMAVFPILIGLGIDYAIQFQNRYTEEMMGGDTNNE